ncbi:MAG TPA: outer membrane lipoprotein carrier protein LolA [Gemmatimonadales bacterium]|nr:outer membrane lipoprotein carrier protein LolA [Gemmatimonadales bacterium]
MKAVVPMMGLTLLVFGLAPQASAQDAAAIVGRSARAYAATSSLRADFVQRIEDSMIGTYDSRGALLQQGENKLSMRFSDPDGDAIIVDGHQVWVYTPSTAPGQVIRMPIPTGATYGLNVLSWILDRPAQRYRMRYLRADKVNGRAVDVVELIPLSSELPFSRAVVWLDKDDALPRRLEIAERRGGVRTITLSHVRTNTRLPQGAFDFTVPDGVRIVDQR